MEALIRLNIKKILFVLNIDTIVESGIECVKNDVIYHCAKVCQIFGGYGTGGTFQWIV